MLRLTRNGYKKTHKLQENNEDKKIWTAEGAYPLNERKPREFWLSKPDCDDFDLNWKNIQAAEFPHKNTLVDCIHVIECSAYEDVVEDLKSTEKMLDACVETGESLRKERDEYRAVLEKIRDRGLSNADYYGFAPDASTVSAQVVLLRNPPKEGK